MFIVLGVSETKYEVKQVIKLIVWEIWPPSDLLSLEWSYCSWCIMSDMYQMSEYSILNIVDTPAYISESYQNKKWRLGLLKQFLHLHSIGPHLSFTSDELFTRIFVLLAKINKTKVTNNHKLKSRLIVHRRKYYFLLFTNLTICVQTILFSLSPTGNYNCLVNSEIECHHKINLTFTFVCRFLERVLWFLIPLDWLKVGQIRRVNVLRHLT